MPATTSGGFAPDFSQRRFAAEYATAQVLAEADRLAEATPRILEAICTTLGWEHAALWRVDPDAERRRRAEEELDRFFSLSPDLLCIAGFDGYLKRLNPAWSRTLGWTDAELRATPYIEFVHPEDLASTSRESEKVSAGAHAIHFENRY